MRLKPSPFGHSVMMSQGARKHSWFPSPVSDCSLCLHRFSPPGLPGCLTKPSMSHFHEMLTFLLGLLTLPSPSTQHPFITVIPMLWVREILPVILRSMGLQWGSTPQTPKLPTKAGECVDNDEMHCLGTHCAPQQAEGTMCPFTPLLMMRCYGFMRLVKSNGFQIRNIWACTQTPPLTSCVTLIKAVNHNVTWYPHL